MRVVRRVPGGVHGSLHTAAEKQSLPHMLRLRFVAASLYLPVTTLSPHTLLTSGFPVFKASTTLGFMPLRTLKLCTLNLIHSRLQLYPQVPNITSQTTISLTVHQHTPTTSATCSICFMVWSLACLKHSLCCKGEYFSPTHCCALYWHLEQCAI